jgi:hypothetical protein
VAAASSKDSKEHSLVGARIANIPTSRRWCLPAGDVALVDHVGDLVASEGQGVSLHGAGQFRIDGHLRERAESPDEITEL